MKRIYLLPIVLLVACSTNPPLPTASGHAVPVNSLSTHEKLAHESGFVVVGEKRNEPGVRKHLLSRPASLSDYSDVPGGLLVERTVTISYPYASARFRPSPEQAFHIRQLLAVADRVELRGRTDSNYETPNSERIARLRALAAKHYLIDRGMPSELISVNFMVTGDHIASNHNKAGRAQNRRVEMEFYIDDLSVAEINKQLEQQPSECSRPIDIAQWQAVGEASRRCTY